MALFVVAMSAGCLGGTEPSSSWSTTRDTLETGVVRVVNTPPTAGVGSGYVVEEDLRIGTVDGSGPDQFGQIKGIAALRDGRIAVLDALAKEIRVFDPSGSHLASFGGQGAGPGEFEGPWGLMLDEEDRLWVPDHANNRMNVVHPDTGFIRSYAMPVLRYGYVWKGVMLRDGRIVKPSISLIPKRRDMLRVYGPEMVLVDSILVPQPDRTQVDPKDPPGAFYWEAPGGRTSGYMSVPFYPQPLRVYSASGDVWMTPGDEPAYRITRAGLRGDTSLVVETRRPPIPVPESTRDSAIQAITESILERGGSTQQNWSKVPRVKPPIEQLFVSHDGQLWVRTASADSVSSFDVYDRDGSFARSVVTTLQLSRYVSPVVRGDHLWGIASDELGVQYVVRGRILAMAAEGAT